MISKRNANSVSLKQGEDKVVTLKIWKVVLKLPRSVEDFELEQIHFVEKENHRCLTEETIIADGFKQLQTLLQAILDVKVNTCSLNTVYVICEFTPV